MSARRVLRTENVLLLRNEGRYVGDIELPEMLHIAFVRSPYSACADQEHRYVTGAGSRGCCRRRDRGRDGGIRHDAAHAARLSDDGVAAEYHAISADASQL
jgi:hypothetical protein